jgi:sialic acid synthase SpsE/mannose-6-phosphate isomerase-like protein (cupin superfamily)
VTRLPEQPLFIFEMANNHMGSLDHGRRIVDEVNQACRGFRGRYQFAVKLQYRHLDTFIHPDFRDRADVKYVRRFMETRLSDEQMQALVGHITEREFISVCTPFDEGSVDRIEEHGIGVIKIASCSFTDWPLLERIALADKPIIASTAGVPLEQIDRVVSFFEHRHRCLALMHCVAEYPTPDEHLHLNQIDLLRSRYPQLRIGYSTHERPENLEAIKIAVGKGASIFERHVGVRTPDLPLNDYSSEPKQIEPWLAAADAAYRICGEPAGRYQPGRAELESLHSLRRGVFASQPIARGEAISSSNTFLAFPPAEGQVTANDLSKYTEFRADADIEANAPVRLSQVSAVDRRGQVYQILQRVKRVLRKSRVVLPSKLDFEISHHYGIENFDRCGATIINFINREYCKKLIVVLPGQTHPEQYHRRKEETFCVLHGKVNLDVNGQQREVSAGDIAIIERGARHTFSSNTGAVIEEISSTHYSDDSYYTDPQIGLNKNRKTLLTYWVE